MKEWQGEDEDDADKKLMMEVANFLKERSCIGLVFRLDEDGDPVSGMRTKMPAKLAIATALELLSTSGVSMEDAQELFEGFEDFMEKMVAVREEIARKAKLN